MEQRVITPDSVILGLLSVQVIPNFFPEELLVQLVTKVQTQGHRKEIFHRKEGEKFPEGIEEASDCISSTFGFAKPNTAILKRYIMGEQSEAFKVHIDPEEYIGTLFLCSLSGRATLSVFSSDMGARVDILCVPNTVVVTPADILHQVSEPFEAYGTRCFLFFGYSSQVNK